MLTWLKIKLWENIKTRYVMPNIPKIHKLKAEITSCKQNKQDVVDFFSRLMGLWSELDNSIKISPYKCETAAKMAKYIEEEKVHQFLVGVDD